MLKNYTTDYPILFMLPVSGYFLYTFIEHLNDFYYMSMIDNLDFFIHELGHILFNITGSELWSVAGGTLFQLFIPLILWLLFFIQKDRFGSTFCMAWLGSNFFYISFYASDAINLDLPLIGTGTGEVIHDWFYMFSHFGVLSHTENISLVFYYTAILLFILSFISTALLVINKFRSV